MSAFAQEQGDEALVEETIIVEGRQTNTGLKTGAPIERIPQSISVIDRDRLNAQLLDGVSDALRFVPGVIGEAFGNDSRVDFLRFRGFDDNGSGVFRDGLAQRNSGFGQFLPELYGVERVEVLRGPASGLFGISNPGGLINLVSKTPTKERFGEVDFLVGNFDTFGTRFDFSGAITNDGKIQARLTGLFRDGDTQVDFVDDQRFYIAPSLKFEPNDLLAVTLLGFVQIDDTGSTNQFIPSQGSVTDNPSGEFEPSTFLGEPEFDDFDREVYSIGYIVDYSPIDNLKITQKLRYQDLDVDSETVFGFGLNGADLTDTSLARGFFPADAQTESFSVDTNALYNFQAGLFSTDILVGIDYLDVELAEQNAFDFADPIDAFNPVFATEIEGPAVGDGTVNDQQQLGIYGQLQTTFAEKFILTLNGRYDIVDDELLDVASGAVTEFDDEEFTGRVGLAYESALGLTPYFNYSTSFEPLLGADAEGNGFDPITGEQFEVGFRYRPNFINGLLSVALFDLTQDNILVPDPDPTVIASVQLGQAQSQGVEIEANASIDQWNFNLAYSFTDAEITEDTVTGNVGNRLGNVPENEIGSFASYTFDNGIADGLTLGGGIRYRSDTVDTANSIEVDGQVLVDLSFQYALENGVRLNVAIENLFDEEFVASCSGAGACFFGPVRRVTARIGYRF